MTSGRTIIHLNKNQFYIALRILDSFNACAFSLQSVVKRNTFKNYNQERNKQQIHQLRTELAQPLLSGSPDFCLLFFRYLLL
ncbi:hypothetical protein RIR_jg10002.t1 [Rhizophagus irregularis DAOM 181602=DAOM 197198]|nr:hypothetical protein RIR_jg10002.t1 [Rhizophagus irregularis DAOM 181602=DAOM 197198]